MEKYTLPVLYMIIGLLVGLSITIRAERWPVQAEFSVPVTPPSLSDENSHSLGRPKTDPIAHLKASLSKGFNSPLSKTFDELMVIPESTKQPVLAMTDEGKEIIDLIRNSHTKTELISNERNDEFLCAGYIYELTARLRWPKGPQRVGLLNPKARMACDAREIPFCYEYYGGKTTYDMGIKHGPELKADAQSFPKRVTPEEMIKFFAAAFRGGNLLGDIGFLFRNSQYLYMLGAYDNYNTHITKNMGLSDFTVTVEYPSEEVGVGNDLLLRNALGCHENMRPLIKPLLSRYSLKINDQPARYLPDGSLVLIDPETEALTPYELQTLDTITYTDVTLVHFYGGEQVSSLLNMSCAWEFFPINVMEINEKFIEKY